MQNVTGSVANVNRNCNPLNVTIIESNRVETPIPEIGDNALTRCNVHPEEIYSIISGNGIFFCPVCALED